MTPLKIIELTLINERPLMFTNFQFVSAIEGDEAGTFRIVTLTNGTHHVQNSLADIRVAILR